MTYPDRILELAMTVVLIIGGYQFYFWAQRRTYPPAAYIETRFDAMISFDPRWVWIYSGLYYPMICLAALSTPDWASFSRTVGCFLSLLVVQVFIFITWPVAIPASWRVVAPRHRSEHPKSMRMLDMVWSYDKLRNSLPSMHVSMAMLVDLTICRNWPSAVYAAWLFPLLIAISALKTKQHYVLDVVPGALAGAGIYFLYWSFAWQLS